MQGFSFGTEQQKKGGPKEANLNLFFNLFFCVESFFFREKFSFLSTRPQRKGGNITEARHPNSLLYQSEKKFSDSIKRLILEEEDILC